MTQFIDFLQNEGYLVTSQRKKIAETIFSIHAHMSIEDIQRELHRRKEKASTATIYRTLDVLVKSGLAVQHRFGKRFKRYKSV